MSGNITADSAGEPKFDIFVLGSCVSRDAFALTDTPLRPVQYVARSSLVSALHPKPAPAALMAGLGNIESSWQRRMVEFDLRRRLGKLLQSKGYDALLLDLVDERFRLGLSGGLPVTISNEFKCSQYPLRKLETLDLGDAKRRKMWADAFAALLEKVSPEKIVLNKVYWATHASDGSELEGQSLIAANNDELQWMYDHILDRHPISLIEYDRELLIADKSHRWGASPFHYVPQMYVRAVERLHEILVQRSLRVIPPRG